MDHLKIKFNIKKSCHPYSYKMQESLLFWMWQQFPSQQIFSSVEEIQLLPKQGVLQAAP